MKSHTFLLAIAIAAATLVLCPNSGHAEEPKPAEPTPAPAIPAAPAPGKISLFDGKELGAWKRVDSGGSGEVTVDKEAGTLDIGFGDPFSGAVYQKAADLPMTNYEISLLAKRVDGSDFFCGLTFPVGDLKTCATFIVGGWGGGVTGISSIDGLDASENETGDFYKIEDGVWYHICVQVTPEKIKAWIDKDEVVDVDIKGKKISLRPGDIELYMPLSITTFQTSSSIKDITITPLPAAK